MGTLVADPAAQPLVTRFGSSAVVAALRGVLAEARAALRDDPAAAPAPADLLASAARALEDRARPTLSPVINATGVVIHTNLGRAPLAPEAVAAMEAAAGYSNLELALDTGRRASRQDHLDALIAEISGAEAGLAVNNCAGAVLLAVAALAEGAPVIVSRGELVEIGGGFRVPDVVAQGGARLVEVGTTNRTHLRDYERALKEHPDARVVLRTHQSNFRMTGFTSAPPLDALAHFAHANGLLLVEDLGGGALVDLAPYGIADEPTVQASLRAGVDLVLFSGDKLLGGPQAGIAAGRRALVERLSAHPLARALRIDKSGIAGLAATLRLYRAPAEPTRRIPVLRMLTETVATIAARAEALRSQVEGAPDLEAWIEETQGYAGGGAMPMLALAGRALALRSRRMSPDQLAGRLRAGATPVLARIDQGAVLLDLRTVSEDELPKLAAAVVAGASYERAPPSEAVD